MTRYKGVYRFGVKLDRWARQTRIVRTPGICGGTATVKSSRIPVWLIALLLWNGESIESIAANYSCNPLGIYAAISYANRYEQVMRGLIYENEVV